MQKDFFRVRMAGLEADNGHLLLLLLGVRQCMGHRADSFEVVVWDWDTLQNFQYLL